MIELTALSQKFKRIGVLGLGVSGDATVKALQHNAINFTAWDTRPEMRERYAAQGLIIEDPTMDYTAGDLVIRSVGIPPHDSMLQTLERNGVALWNDLDLLYFANPQARFLGVTGTNGKSTTTTLIGHILKENNVPVAIGGNLGPAAPSLPVLGSDGIYVLELSSYQLATSKLLRCDIAVLLNITEDHLDWHGTMDEYIAAKALIFRLRDHQKQCAIIGLDSPATHALYATLVQSPNHMVVGVTQTGADGVHPMVSLRDNRIHTPDGEQRDWPVHAVLKGRHNDENRLLACVACRAVGLSRDDVFAAMATFKGLKHRQQPVATYKNITFINDSKATNADATSKALAVFDHIYWIVGGKDKSDGIDGLDVYYPNIKQAYLIGASTDRFASQLEGKLSFKRCETITNALRAAFADAQNSGQPATILLSPACASFDQYANFEQRGDDFITHVDQLLKEIAV